MKYLRIIILVLVVAVIVYMPVSMLFATAQAAEGVEETQQAELLPITEGEDGSLAPTIHTPESYIAPQYDPFNNKHRPDETFIERVEEELEGLNTPPLAKISVQVPNGIADRNSGTTNTEFRFNAHGSNDSETSSSQLQVRWDFESDGEYDTYFSRTKNVRHTFEQPGAYNVTLEVLDSGGLISSTTKEVTVVENTEPFAFFTFKPETGTTAKIFTFDTSESDDSQYKQYALAYRFDWDGDRQWDTPYKEKRVWRHMFEEPGVYNVVMEVKDPEGATSLAGALVTVVENQAPTAFFSVETKEVQVSKDEARTKYLFDASVSSDPEGERLQYRWDFNYTGENDINFSTNWSTSPKYSGFYDFPGEKVVRLQVRDIDGEVHETFRLMTVE